MEYPAEEFTLAERKQLEPYFTNVDKPVFALVNLPETVKGALFARYSRYPGTLRRLFLEEFADTLPATLAAWDGDEGKRAAELYERIFVGYGDDSIAQLGGVHIACEWTSNILTKLLQRPRVGAYLEQSTRYIPYDTPMPNGGYRYYSDRELGPRYRESMDELFKIYAAILPRVEAWAAVQYPRGDGEPEGAYNRAIRAKALDLVRGLLPAATLSHMGIYATGQTYEQLVLHLLASPLSEARDYGKMILHELQQVIPSFVARVDRPDRGGRWSEFLRDREQTARAVAQRLEIQGARTDAPSVRLLRTSGTEQELAAALLFEATGASEAETLAKVDQLDSSQLTALLTELVGERDNRRHRPGRGFEAVNYRFEIVSDYGAFRDLQRHRMLTVQWQSLSPDLGAGVPEGIEEAGVLSEYQRGLAISAAEYQRLSDAGFTSAAPYALCLGYRIRYILDLNAREAMHLIELRSGREGHATYRAVAHEMYEQVAAVHPRIAAAMTHIDRDTEPRLERIMSELRTQRKLAAL